jgi:hypothetical protein
VFFNAEDAQEIPVALERFFEDRGVATSERVFMSPKNLGQIQAIHSKKMSFFIALQKPDEPGATNDDDYQSKPFGLAYQPINPAIAWLPGLDDHTGNGPEAGDVAVDHTLVLGTPRSVTGGSIPTSQSIRAKVLEAMPELEGIYPNYVTAWREDGLRPNGDWVVDLETGKLRRVPVSELKGLFLA